MFNLFNRCLLFQAKGRQHFYTIGLVILSFVFSCPTKTVAGNNKFHAINSSLSDTLPTATPVYWKWATVWGGNEDESSPFLRKGTDGSVFVIGMTNGDNSLPTTNGVYQPTHDSKFPLFISRFDTTGTLIYSTYTGADGSNNLRDVEVYDNEVYLMYDVNGGDAIKGQTHDDFDANGLGAQNAVSSATVIEKFDPTGNLAWSTVIDGNAGERGYEIVANDGGLWFHIGTKSTDIRLPGNAYQSSNAGELDHFVGNLGFDGTPGFATYFGGTGDDNFSEFGVVGFAANATSLVFAGYSEKNTGFPLMGTSIDNAFISSPNTISRINIDGSLAYSIYYGQSEDVQPVRSIALDENGNTYIATNEYEGFLPTTIGAYQEFWGTGIDAHLASLDGSGNLNWATYLGGNDDDYIDYMHYKDGHLFMVGTSQSVDFPTTPNSFPYVADGTYDVFVAKFQPNGTEDYIHLYGGLVEDELLAFDSENGCATLLINQEDEGFPVTSDPLSSLQGDNNVAMRINADGSLAYSMPIECAHHLSDKRMNIYSSPENGVVAIGDNICYISMAEEASFPTTEGAYFNNYIDNFDFYLGCIGPIDCPELTDYDSTNVVSPTTVMACKDGTIPGFTGTEVNLINDSLDIPTIYKSGQPVAGTEGFYSVNYQWQAYNEVTLAWVNVGGAITKDFLPPPTSGNVTYRRAVFTNNATCDTLFSNEVLVEVETSPFAPTLPADTIYQKCGSSTITLDATATGGTGPYTYFWSPTTDLAGASGCSTFPNCPVMECSVTESTIYIVTVIDANGCVQTEQYTVNVYDPLVYAGPDVVSCDGTGLQLGAPHIAPGTGDFSYEWSPNDGSLSCITCPQPIATPTVTTVYTLEVTGPDGCIVSDNVTLTVASVTADAGPDSVAVCVGDIYEIGEPWVFRHTYRWAPLNYIDNALIAQPDFKVGSLPTPNPYQYTVTKTHTITGCQDVDAIKVFSLLADAGPDGCGPRTVGTPDPHGFPVTYDWTIAQVTGGTTADVSVSCTDCPQPFINYDNSTVQVWMSVCVSYLGTTCCDTVWLPDCQCPFPDPVGVSDADCAIADLALNTTLAGSADTANYNYLWTADTNGVAINNPLGIADVTNPFEQPITITLPFDVTYTLTATDKVVPGNSCSGSVEIFSSFTALPIAMTNDTSTCVGVGVPIGSSATAGWSASWKGIQGDTMELDNTQSFNPIFTPTSAGIYTFEVSVADDVTQCAIKDTVTIEVIEIIADAGEDISFCDQAIIQIGTAGIPDLIYSWEPITVSDPTIAQPFDTVYGTTEYRLLVTDALGGCPQRDTVKVIAVSPPPFDAGPDVSVCEGGSSQIGNTAVVGQSYLWSPSTGLDDPNISNPMVTPSLTAPGSQIYSVTVSNGNAGCIIIDEVEVSVLAPEPIDAGMDVEVCKGETVQIGNATNAGTIQWSPIDYLDNPNAAQPNLTMPLTGVNAPLTYTLTIVYPSGCQQQDEVIITPIMATVDAGTNQIQCEGEVVQIGTTGETGYTYLWTPSTGLSDATAAMPDAAPDVTTTYTLTASSPNGCEATDMVTVTYQSVTADAGPDVTVCPSTGPESIGTAAQAGFSYQWSPASGLNNSNIAMPTATVTTVTDYILTVTHNTTGCESKDTVTVSPSFNLSLGNDLTICQGDEVEIGIVDPADGTTFSWSPGGATTSLITVSPGLNTTTYTLSATKSGCTITDDINITVKPGPNANAGNPTVICSGACIEIGGPSEFGNTYSWYPTTGLSNGNISNPIACPTETTPYTLTVVNSMTGCVAMGTTTVAVTNVPAPPVDAGPDKDICPGESTILGALPQKGFTYSWSPTAYLSNPYVAQPTFLPPSSPAPISYTYYLNMTDNTTGCYKQDTVIINLNRLPVVPSVSDVSLCTGSSAELCLDCTENAAYTYLWSPSTNLDDPTKLNAIASPTSTTFYTLEVTETATSCNATVFVEATVDANPSPTADAGIDQQICEGTSVQVGSTDLGDTYEWGPTALQPYITPSINNSQITFTAPDTGEYTLTLLVTNANTCTNTDEVTVTVLPEATAYAGTNQYICVDEFEMQGTPATIGTGTWTYESGPSTPAFANTNDANTTVSGLSTGIHVFKWTITGDNICNSGAFDYVTLIYEDPNISLEKNKCQPNTDNYDVIVLISDGSLYSVSEGVVGAINEYTTVSMIDSSAQLQVIAVSGGNCRDTTLISPPACPDCVPLECLPMNGELKRGEKE